MSCVGYFSETLGLPGIRPKGLAELDKKVIIVSDMGTLSHTRSHCRVVQIER